MKRPVMTHEEACGLVEGAIERCAKTLAYIRLKLERKPALSLFDLDTVEQANILCNINWHGAYLKGANAMYRALINKGFLDFYAKKEDKITNDAILKAYMQNTRNMEWLLTDLPVNVEVRTIFERDKKGKVVAATSKFVRKKTEYKEI